MRVIPDIPLQLHPTAIGSLDLLALHTNRQYSTKTRQLAIPGLIQGALGLDSVCHIDATADIAEELIVLAEERSTPVEYPAIFPSCRRSRYSISNDWRFSNASPYVVRQRWRSSG